VAGRIPTSYLPLPIAYTSGSIPRWYEALIKLDKYLQLRSPDAKLINGQTDIPDSQSTDYADFQGMSLDNPEDFVRKLETYAINHQFARPNSRPSDLELRVARSWDNTTFAAKGKIHRHGFSLTFHGTSESDDEGGESEDITDSGRADSVNEPDDVVFTTHHNESKRNHTQSYAAKQQARNNKSTLKFTKSRPPTNSSTTFQPDAIIPSMTTGRSRQATTQQRTELRHPGQRQGGKPQVDNKVAPRKSFDKKVSFDRPSHDLESPSVTEKTKLPPDVTENEPSRCSAR